MRRHCRPSCRNVWQAALAGPTDADRSIPGIHPSTHVPLAPYPSTLLLLRAQRPERDADGALEGEAGDVVGVLGLFEVGAGLGEAELGVAQFELGDLAGLFAFGAPWYDGLEFEGRAMRQAVPHAGAGSEAAPDTARTGGRV